MSTAATETRARASAMPPDERRAAIVSATVPLLLEHGSAVSTRQIAEAAGIAEGTIFRVFADKDSLVQAAIEKHLDPEPLREALRCIDPALPLEHKVRAIILLMQERFRSVFRMLAVVGAERPPVPQERAEFASIIEGILAPEAERLNWPPRRAAYILRLLAFASSFPALNEGVEFSVDELTRVVLTGLAGHTEDAAIPTRPL